MTTTKSLTRLGRVSCVINPLSGSTPANAADLVREKLSGLPDEAKIHEAGEGDIRDIVKAALADKPDVLIVWGGDGTIACALSHAGPDGPAVLPLPGGTMNLLPHRAIGEIDDWKSILDSALNGGEIRDMACGEVIGGDRFFVAAMIGDMTRLTQSREALREGRILEAAQIVHDDSALSLDSNIEWGEPGKTPETATAVTVNINADTPGLLEVATINPGNLIDLAKTGIQMLNDGWRDAESVDVRNVPEVDVTVTNKRLISLTLDGELTEMEPPVRFRRIDVAARIFVPDMSS